MLKVKFVALIFDGVLDTHVFSNWLSNMECCFNCYEMSKKRSIRFIQMMSTFFLRLLVLLRIH